MCFQFNTLLYDKTDSRLNSVQLTMTTNQAIPRGTTLQRYIHNIQTITQNIFCGQTFDMTTDTNSTSRQTQDQIHCTYAI